MARIDLIEALTDRNRMAEYLEVRNDEEIIADIKSVIAPELALRDQFAMAALTGAITSASNLGSSPPHERYSAFIAMGGILYEIADAMLKAREASHG